MLKKIRLEKLRRKMKKDFKTFFKATEPKSSGSDYIYGRHTLGLIGTCQKAFDIFQKGISSYIMVNVPYQHGKSDVISRRFPPWVLINNPSLKILEGCATSELAKEMSYDSRRCFESVSSLYNTRNEKDFNTATSWRTVDGGCFFGTGLGGTAVGRGSHIGIIDDYFRNRADADSEVVRNRIWEAFTNDFLTRLAPVHIFIIVSTRWHEDDLCGRIQDKNNPKHDSYDKDFPVFEVIKYKAQNDDGSYLFPERISDKMYSQMKSALGEYGWNALAQQDPRPRQGNILKAERVKIVDNIEMQEDMEWHLGIDLAHSDAGKGDPDYTVVTLACFFESKIYVKSVWRFQQSVLRRDERIKSIVSSLPDYVDMIIEQAGASKDAFLSLRNEFEDYLMVRRYINKVGKVGHANKLEPIFELGNVIIEKADWNMGWINELKAFPGGKHDDQMDSLFIAISREIVLNKYMFSIDKDEDLKEDKERVQEDLTQDDYF